MAASVRPHDQGFALSFIDDSWLGRGTRRTLRPQGEVCPPPRHRRVLPPHSGARGEVEKLVSTSSRCFCVGMTVGSGRSLPRMTVGSGRSLRHPHTRGRRAGTKAKPNDRRREQAGRHRQGPVNTESRGPQTQALAIRSTSAPRRCERRSPRPHEHSSRCSLLPGPRLTESGTGRAVDGSAAMSPPS